MSLEIRHVAIAQVALVSSDARVAAAVVAAMSDDETAVVRRAWGGDSAETPVPWERPDVVVLDDEPGAAAEHRIAYLRRRWPTLLVAVVNALDEAHAGALLDAGADEVVLTDAPLAAARLRALARRARALNAASRVAIGDVVFEREARRVWCAGSEVELAPREFAVLDCLFWHAPNLVSPDALADYVWGDAEVVSRKGAVEVYIGYLRKKLSASRKVVIGTVRGEGYRFEARS